MRDLRDLPRRQLVVALVVLVLVSPFAVYAVPGLAGADESYVVLTGSMRPAIDPGDVVLVRAVDPATVEAGDVITFDRGGEVPTTHRVIEVVGTPSDPAFRTQGDANEDPDGGVVPAADVRGVVVLTIPFVGTIISAADTGYGFLALVVLPFVLLVLDVALERYRRGRGAEEVPTAAATDGDRSGSEATDPRDSVLPFVGTQVLPDGDGAESPAVGTSAATAETVADPDDGRAVAPLDLHLSLGVLAVLALYAAWNAYWQFTTLDAPRPETMSVLSGSLVALAFLAYLRYAGGGDETEAAAPTADAAVVTDGGDETPTAETAPDDPQSSAADAEVSHAN